METGRQLKKEKRLVAHQGRQEPQSHPPEHGSFAESRNGEEKRRLQQDLARAQLGVSLPRDQPYLWVDHDHLYEDQVRRILLSAKVPLVGYAASAHWLTPPIHQVWSLTFYEPGVCKATWRGNKLVAFRYERFSFDSDGSLVKIVTMDNLKTPEHARPVPTLVRRAAEKSPLTAEEAWGALAALAAAFANVRLSLKHAADGRVIKAMRGVEADYRSVVRRLRAPELWLLEQELSAGMHAYWGEEFANRLAKVVAQLEGKKQPGARVHFMGPSVACFELLFGRPPEPAGSSKPTAFASFVVAFLKEMEIDWSWKSVRRYLQDWQARTASVGTNALRA